MRQTAPAVTATHGARRHGREAAAAAVAMAPAATSGEQHRRQLLSACRYEPDSDCAAAVSLPPAAAAEAPADIGRVAGRQRFISIRLADASGTNNSSSHAALTAIEDTFL